MDKAIAGNVVLGSLLVLMVGKVLADQPDALHRGSGGVFAPSLFTGAMAGMAFGSVVSTSSAPGWPPRRVRRGGHGGVFGGAAQAPLTAIASVVEMTGNFTLVLPVMLTTGIAAACPSSSATAASTPPSCSPGRRHRAAQAGQRAADPQGRRRHASHLTTAWRWRGRRRRRRRAPSRPRGRGEVGRPHRLGDRHPPAPGAARRRDPEQALRELTLYGRVGLPVSPHRHRLTGWITRRQVLRAMTNSFSTSAREAERGAIAAEFGDPDPHARVHTPSSPSAIQ